MPVTSDNCTSCLEMPKTRKEIRRGVRDNYLARRARKSYRHGPTLNSLFEEQPSPRHTYTF